MALTIAIEGKGVIANCDATTNDTGGTGTGDWSEEGGGTMSLSTDSYKFGSASIGGQYASKSGFQQFDLGAGNELDFTAGTGTESGQYLYIWINVSALGTLDTLSTYPLCIRLSSDSPGTSNYIDYLIAGNDDKNGWDGKWKCFIIDPTKTASRVSGTQSSIIAAVRTLGLWIDTSTSARADAFFIDQLAVGSGLRITGTSTTSWKDVVDYCTDYPNRAWGMFQEREGIYYGYGMMNIGNTTQAANVSFTDSGRIIQFGISEYCTNAATGTWASSLPVGVSGINVEDHASYTTTFKDGVIVGTDNGRSGSTIIGNTQQNISLDLYGGNHANSVSGLYGTTLQNLTGALNSGNDIGHEFLGSSFNKCSQFDPVGGCLIRNCTFAETSDVDSALLWNENINIQYCKFIANTLGAAIEHPSSAGTPYTHTGLQFSANTYDVLNSSGSAITINNSGDPKSDGSLSEGSTVTFLTARSLTVKVQDKNTNLIENAQVAIYKLSDKTQLMNEDTLATGIATESYTGANADIEVRVRKTSTGTVRYSNFSTLGSITSADYNLLVTLLEDSIAST